MTATLFAPPDQITWWHARTLEAATSGALRYDTREYPIHGLPNNAVWCIWHGLLADGPDRPVITELGQALLDTYRANQPNPEPVPTPEAPALSTPTPAPTTQAALF